MPIVEIQSNPFAFLWRYKWYVIGAALVAAAVSYGGSMLETPTYRAEGTVFLNDPRASGGIADEIGLVLDVRSHVRNQAKLMESETVAQRAALNLADGSSASDIQNATTATPEIDFVAVTVSAKAAAPNRSVGLVDAVVAAYEEIVTEQVLATTGNTITTLEDSKTDTEQRIAELDALIAENPDDSTLQAQRTAAIDRFVVLDTRIEQLATSADLYGSGVQLYAAPDTPTDPVKPLPNRNAALGFVFGFLGAGAWAWWRTESTRVVRDRHTPAHILGAPMLATIPDYALVGVEAPVPTATDQTSAVARAYEYALSSVRFALDNVDGTTVLITSTAPGEGKTSTALNLAIMAAQSGLRPLLVDADVRVAGLTGLSDLDGAVGISDLGRAKDAASAVHVWSVAEGTDIEIVPSGSRVGATRPGFFRTEGFRTAVGKLVSDHTMVIVDSPPATAVAETADVAAVADAIVLVVGEGTQLASLEDARQRLTMSGTPIVGYIYNKARSKTDLAGYGYGYGYESPTDQGVPSNDDKDDKDDQAT